jgi:hypothetical protein
VQYVCVLILYMCLILLRQVTFRSHELWEARQHEQQEGIMLTASDLPRCVQAAVHLEEEAYICPHTMYVSPPHVLPHVSSYWCTGV